MQHKSLFILGRQPAIGRAELESVLGSEHVGLIGLQAVGSDIDPTAINFERLGGSIRMARILTVLHTTQWPELMRYVTDYLPQHLAGLPEGKLKLGLSVFDLQVGVQSLFRTGL